MISSMLTSLIANFVWAWDIARSRLIGCRRWPFSVSSYIDDHASTDTSSQIIRQLVGGPVNKGEIQEVCYPVQLENFILQHCEISRQKWIFYERKNSKFSFNHLTHIYLRHVPTNWTSSVIPLKARYSLFAVSAFAVSYSFLINSRS